MASHHVERNFIRSLVASALCIALLTSVWMPVPRDAKGKPDLPDIAFEQVSLYRLEAALLVFYGGLLMITPAFAGLVRGRLPTEISARGAKFAEEANRSAELTDAKIDRLEGATNALAEEMITAQAQIEQLEEVLVGDSTQRGVHSQR